MALNMKKKTRKFIKSPLLFFKDAIVNRIQNSIINASIASPLDNKKKLTFAFHINDWKKPIIESWWPDRRFIYIPMDSNTSNLESAWLKKIQSLPQCDIFVWGMNLPNIMKNIPNRIFYIEDGFIRSIGLGAAHTPPTSLNIDNQTCYFDAGKPSDLEDLLNTYDFSKDKELIKRAREMIKVLITSGISKYNHACNIDIKSIYGEKVRRRILVIGQVEDDASIKYGCEKPFTNNELVILAAIENPDAEIIYKPHPDVLNGYREQISDPSSISHICKIIKMTSHSLIHLKQSTMFIPLRLSQALKH